jgi:lipid II:glycine glycyltransferase (peptidoglycan interpeptide bridge formation enzyme)
MKMRYAFETELQDWDERVLTNPDGGNIFQSLEFAEQKQLGGWQPRFILTDRFTITALEKPVLGLGKLWYLPKGPGVSDIKQLQNLLPSLSVFAKKQGVFGLKIEPELLKTTKTTDKLRKLGFIKTTPIQPNFSTVLIDLTPDLNEILANLNQKGRHAIRRAERDGVQVKLVDVNETNCQLMYELLAETAASAFQVRRYEYYKTFWQRFSKSGYGQLFFAYVNNQVVAGAYVLIFGNKSTYKDGASTRQRTVYGASHLLQWEAIKWAKAHGSGVHDLCGSPPSDQINNTTHPHYGIGRFKASFNKHVTDYVGAYDLPIGFYRYKLWSKLLERIVRRWQVAARKGYWY